jgi:hypothetical protein
MYEKRPRNIFPKRTILVECGKTQSHKPSPTLPEMGIERRFMALSESHIKRLKFRKQGWTCVILLYLILYIPY